MVRIILTDGSLHGPRSVGSCHATKLRDDGDLFQWRHGMNGQHMGSNSIGRKCLTIECEFVDKTVKWSRTLCFVTDAEAAFDEVLGSRWFR